MPKVNFTGATFTFGGKTYDAVGGYTYDQPRKPTWEEARAQVERDRVAARRAHVRKLARQCLVGGVDDVGLRPMVYGERTTVIYSAGFHLPNGPVRLGPFERAPLHAHPLFPMLGGSPARN